MEIKEFTGYPPNIEYAVTAIKDNTLKHKLIAAALTGILSNPYTLNDEKVVVDAIFSVVDKILARLESESK